MSTSPLWKLQLLGIHKWSSVVLSNVFTQIAKLAINVRVLLVQYVSTVSEVEPDTVVEYVSDRIWTTF